MPYTVPNQRRVTVHRELIESDFLGIKNSNWQSAARDLGAQSLLLYLYFASNANGFTLALSPAAIRQAVGMPPQTYRDQFMKLIDKGYLVQRGSGNTYDFYETPKRATCSTENNTDDGYNFTDAVQNTTAENIEINKNNTNNIDNGGEKQASPAPKFKF